MTNRGKDFLDKIVEISEMFPDRRAITDVNGKSITYSELVSKMLEVAYTLRRDLPYKSRMLFLIPGTAQNMAKALGILYAGHTVVNIDPFTSDELFKSRALKADVTHAVVEQVLLTGGRFNKAISSLTGKQIADAKELDVPIFVGRGKQNAQSSDRWLNASGFGSTLKNVRVGEITDSAVIVFTSGTTAEPKGVSQSFLSLTAGLDEVRERFNITHESKVVSEPMTLGLVALTSGAEWIQHWNPKTMKKADVWFGTPYEANMLAEKALAGKDGLTVGTLGIGAGPVLPALVDKIDRAIKVDNILCVYGMTEILPIAIGDAREKRSYLSGGDYVGEPLEHVHVKVVNGELYVKGIGLASYLNYDNYEWLPTGDFADVISDSEYGGDEVLRIVLQGRKKDMFIRRDMNIYPGLYEPAINTIPGVQEAYLTGVPGKYGDDYMVLVVKPEKGVNTDSLHKLISSRIPAMMDAEAIPDHVLFFDKIPTSGRANKLDRRRLQELVSEEIGTVL